MRKADFDVAWKECRAQPLAHLSISLITTEKDGAVSTLPIASRLTALIGVNGSGKTGLLSAISAAINGADAARQVTSVSGRFRNQPFSAHSGDGVGVEDLEVTFIDVSARCHSILEFINSQQDFDDLVAQSGLDDVSGKDLERYRYAAGRSYSAVRIAELELPSLAYGVDEAARADAEPEIFPYFQVASGAAVYDCRSMGFGELCICYLTWRLWRLAKGTVLLLDEPDSHLSPKARQALVNLCALAAHERQLAVIFTSHFIEPLALLKEGEVGLVEYDDATATTLIAPVSVKRLVLRKLGLAPAKRLLIVVEDVDAQEVVRQLVNRWGDGYANVIDIQIVGGASDVVRFLTLFPSECQVCRIIAVLDGDKRQSYGNVPFVFFLPGTTDPITAARASLDVQCMSFAEHLGVCQEALRAALARIRHINDHDFCAALLDEMQLQGRNVQSIRESLVRVWLANEPTLGLARELAESFAGVVDQIPLDL